MSEFKEELIKWSTLGGEPDFARLPEFKEIIESMLRDYRTVEDHKDDKVCKLLNIIRDRYSWKGMAYHGITSMVPYRDLLGRYDGFTSFTDDIKVAYNFASNGDTFFRTTVIIEKYITGINFNKFLLDIKDYLKTDIEWFESYLNEKEIITFDKLHDCRVLDVRGKTLGEVKEIITLTVGESVDSDYRPEAYTHASSDNSNEFKDFKLDIF